MRRSTPKPIDTYPPRQRPPQLGRADLAKMTPAAIDEARKAGALEDLLNGREPEATS